MVTAVNSVLISLIAVAGTLLGSLTTYVFQRRTAAHVEAVGRRERLRQDRLVACGDFAAAVTEVKRAVITAWFRRDARDEQWRAAMTEADRTGAVAEGAQIRVLLPSRLEVSGPRVVRCGMILVWRRRVGGRPRKSVSTRSG
jgi:hypothetical protein